MDAAPRPLRAGLAAAILVAVAALIGWALFAGGGAGSGATAPLGTAAIVVATLLLVGWARGARRVPAPRSCRACGRVAAVGLVAWTGLTLWWSIAGDRSWDALAKGIVLLAFGVVGFAVSLCRAARFARSPLSLAAALGAVLCWALLGKAVPALGPDDAGRVARLRGTIGYWNALALLADAALGLGLWLVSPCATASAGLPVPCSSTRRRS